MNRLSRYSLQLLLILAAITSYQIGFSGGILLFIILGVSLEAAFWISLVTRKNSNKKGA